MFEDSLVESCVGQVSSSKRWTMLASVSLQVALATVVIVLPLLHPDLLPLRVEAPKVVMPLTPKPPVRVAERESTASSSSFWRMATELMRPLLPNLHPMNGEPPPVVPFGGGMEIPGGLPDEIRTGGGNGPAVSAVSPRAPVVPLHVSTGVLQAMLISPIRPVYPAIAKAAHLEGTVVVQAVISRTGTIESLRVVSGPLMLQRAAMDAIREARYQPFRLNGEPTEVETTITVNFRLGG